MTALLLIGGLIGLIAGDQDKLAHEVAPASPGSRDSKLPVQLALILAAQDHKGLGTFSAAMMGFVVPITVIAMVVALIRRRDGDI